jgi:hypothetical protein
VVSMLEIIKWSSGLPVNFSSRISGPVASTPGPLPIETFDETAGGVERTISLAERVAARIQRARRSIRAQQTYGVTLQTYRSHDCSNCHSSGFQIIQVIASFRSADASPGATQIQQS